jgi:integrase
MAGTVRTAKIDNPTSRKRLKPGRHWRAIIAGRAHLGYERRPGKEARWLLRRYVAGKYRVIALGIADDAREADGVSVLSYDQAFANATAQLGAHPKTKGSLTVRAAMAHYVEHKENLGQSVADVLSRGNAHILPVLGDLFVNDLTAEELRRWLRDVAASPAQTRPKGGKVMYRAKTDPTDDEAVRKRRATSNRALGTLKAILNFAFDEGFVSNRDAWGRKLKPFPDADAARVRYLSIAEAQRLINACDPEFRLLVRGALETGARYSELARLQVIDFNSDAGTVHVRKSKSGKARHIHLTDEGSIFFQELCAGRAGSDLMFRRSSDKSSWTKSEQHRPMAAANKNARLSPPIGFHGLRHTWASLSVMAGMPLLVVAKNLGHA